MRINLKNIFYTILILLFFSCNINSKKEIDDLEEISSLKNNSEKELFLTEIFNFDQSMRGEKSSNILLKFGKNSKQYKKYLIKMDSLDKVNLKKIKRYLNKFGYPNSNTFTEKANITPWVVIHHSDLKTRLSYYPNLKKAYQESNLSIDHFELYLTRTFLMQKGYYPNSEGVYNREKKIEYLINELNLKG
ncbi:hypothetical protein LX95_02292 [Mesonia algae]|uniref:Uncharacterized protein n=1 Tax=Mesonia algae TaxID=213248 RepID=A0A2W7HWV2_9FLAO|nr:hypothetical protein [Mesonia algae]PZW39151.1 hypothetical protein LX95_02292 [Mesonia algae]